MRAVPVRPRRAPSPEPIRGLDPASTRAAASHATTGELQVVDVQRTAVATTRFRDDSPPVASPPLVSQPRRQQRRRRPQGPRRRWLLVGVAMAAAVAIALGAVDLGLYVSRHGASPASSPTTTQVTAPSTSQPPPGTSTTASTSTTTPASGPKAPLATAVIPARARPGDVVAVSGENFYSPKSGVVLARIDGQPAETACPSQTSCRVTIPKLGHHPKTVAITITTDSGTSNPVFFRYI